MPLEERKYKDINQFGEGDQAKVCVDIMHKTGAHLELSLAKDQGLSIMVSGKLDAVMKARKEIVSRLQTQVERAIHFYVECIRHICLQIMDNCMFYSSSGFSYCCHPQGAPSFCHWQKWGEASGVGVEDGHQNPDSTTR